ncbi:MAG: glyoxalase/bleomycin resistance/extradiol dioxygenase family protein [Flavobacteriales bacterium]|jgi:predicted lactoylglutathione lyase|nr:glyoxalase/bleomycin resistance/extradiol dioxygenase family protein [Flavobacteriales bacterium]MBK6891757.1 glyoxalase/bleomycin resistance/extradiol dioxygenase family protein [Flavobacteriales bacterium]MBK7247678.1 glyoxalase/bleomycin resistance/extradiol dioxygenase family protein [Flavobacteriales bacterium]QQS72954.1 MAG: glyoxalase/bleomycin resistance/extradiol dioxygenase family protein [Flavobacteriales bacterium]HQV40152.1 glyoxalase/bleomycin resistance/extradiol dioxygenase f
MTTQIFVNMQVNDLAKSKAFFEALDYSFNAQFTNDDAAALVISDTIYAMLHTPTSMTRFLPKGKSAAVPTKQTEVLLALSFESKDAVDTIYDKAIAAGATECRPTEDHGFMYGRSFNDLDGHIWEVFWMGTSSVD